MSALCRFEETPSGYYHPISLILVKYRTLIRKPAPMPANPVILSIMSLEHTPKPVDTNSPEPL